MKNRLELVEDELEALKEAAGVGSQLTGEDSETGSNSQTSSGSEASKSQSKTPASPSRAASKSSRRSRAKSPRITQVLVSEPDNVAPG